MKYEFQVTSIRTTNSLVTIHATNLKEVETVFNGRLVIEKGYRNW